MTAQLQPGDKVTTLTGSIDRNQHKGAIGVVQGFARFSSYHPREVSVAFEDGSAAWFWESGVRAALTPPHHSHKFLSAYPDSFAA